MASLQKRLASRILKVGVSRIWLNPTQKKDIEAAITAADIRKLIEKRAIKARPEKISMPKIKKKGKRGHGSKKGKKHSIVPSKRKWISTVRPLRKMLKELKTNKEIDNPTFKKLYRLVKGGMFRSRSHLKIYLEQRGLLKKK